MQGHALLRVRRQEVSLWPPGSHSPAGQAEAHADRHSPSQRLQRRGSQGGAQGGEGECIHQSAAPGTSAGHTQVLSTLISGRCVLETSKGICSVQPVRWAGQGHLQPHFAGGKLPLRDEAACLKHCREDAQSLVLSHTHSRLPEQEGRCCTRVKLNVGSLSIHAGFGLVHLCDCFFTG